MISENVNRPYSTNKHVFSFLWGETDFSVYAFNSRNQGLSSVKCSFLFTFFASVTNEKTGCTAMQFEPRVQVA
jgi:hypothetical protein